MIEQIGEEINSIKESDITGPTAIIKSPSPIVASKDNNENVDISLDDAIKAVDLKQTNSDDQSIGNPVANLPASLSKEILTNNELPNSAKEVVNDAVLSVPVSKKSRKT